MLEEEKKLITKVLSEDRSTQVLEGWYNDPMKSTEIASDLKERGNEIYRKSNHNAETHEIIWKLYSLSIANAPLSSEELAVAYGNRSALLFHLKKHKDSIADIDRALEITKSNSLKIKLLARKNQCFTALESTEEKLSYDITKLNKSSVNQDKLAEFFLNQSCVSDITSDSFYNNLAIDDFNEFQELLAIKKVCDPFDLVSLKYNEKYGRHLVAKRDIKPGEIIMVEKPFYKCVNLNTIYTTCSHCLKTSWATIPCDHCNLSMYCSEGCKKEAWKMYHDMECAVVPNIIFNQVADYWKQLALRIIIIEIKKSGSINKLRQEVKKLLSCDDKLHKGFVNGKFSNDQFSSILSLSCAVDDETLKQHADHAVLTLLALVKFTSLFGKDDKFHCGQDLISNKDVIFVGSLILKMMKISDINAYCVEDDSPCRFSFEASDCDFNRCCEKGSCLASLPSFFNHSCDPNVKSVFTEDMHMVTFSLQPIKKNSQMFASYIGFFCEKPILTRELELNHFNFKCTGPCCKKNWPQISDIENYLTKNNMNYNVAEIKFLEKYIPLVEEFERGKFENPWSYIKKLSKGVEEASLHLTQPSYLICVMIMALLDALSKTYCYKLRVPNNC